MRSPGGEGSDGPEGSPLEVRLFSGGAFAQNGYLLRCPVTNRAAIVDPGAAAREMVEALRASGSEVEAVYLTHAHLDHVEGLPAVREHTDAPIHLHPADLPLYERAGEQAEAFGVRGPGALPPVDRELRPGTPVHVGEAELEIRFTPGHSPGHVILRSEAGGFALVGDVVFQGSVGRTDLPGGDFQQLIASIRGELLTLPDETRLLPGHGPETTVGHERRGNPFLIPHYGGELA